MHLLTLKLFDWYSPSNVFLFLSVMRLFFRSTISSLLYIKSLKLVMDRRACNVTAARPKWINLNDVNVSCATRDFPEDLGERCHLVKLTKEDPPVHEGQGNSLLGRTNPVARTAHLRSLPRHRGGITASNGTVSNITETIIAHLW